MKDAFEPQTPDATPRLQQISNDRGSRTKRTLRAIPNRNNFGNDNIMSEEHGRYRILPPQRLNELHDHFSAHQRRHLMALANDAVARWPDMVAPVDWQN